MSKTIGIRRGATWATLAAILAVLGGMTCPPGGDTGGGALSIGNTPPRIIITSITTPSAGGVLQQGENATISFTGQDAENVCKVRIFASTSPAPSSATPIITILSGFTLGPGQGGGQAVWNTTGVAIGTYNIFAEIDDQTFDPLTGSGNPPVRVTSATLVQVTPLGSQPLPATPRIVFVDPKPNLGPSAQDDLTVRYIYSDTDSPVTVTLLLDKDKIPTNDDINNPGDPQNPNTNIIILPSEPRRPTDPTFPLQADTDELRTNPRSLPQTAGNQVPFPGAPINGVLKEYRFTIDLSRIPVRSQPYYIRATITDGKSTRHAYAVGSITITNLAFGVVDAGQLGFSVAGARFQGFSAFENFGTDFVPATDLDSDLVDDFLIAGRYASPRQRARAGAAYLVFGRRKTPFPPDTNGNGLPDVPDSSGGVLDFPTPPTFVPNPYDAALVGRFGGTNSINSVGSFFRGTAYTMPRAFGPTQPPSSLVDPELAGITSAGLTSITRVSMTADDVADIVFGMPFISSPRDHIDDDPSDGSCQLNYDSTGDVLPNAARCTTNTQEPRDDLYNPYSAQSASEPRDGVVDTGLVIVVSGATDLNGRTSIDAGMAGQFDPIVATDDENVIVTAAQTPTGMRFRGAWWARGVGELAGPQDGIQIASNNEFGETVSAYRLRPSDSEGLLISVPGHDNERGMVLVCSPNDYTDGRYYPDGVRSLPGYALCPQPCRNLPGTPSQTACERCYVTGAVTPVIQSIIGLSAGDRLGRAVPAGDVNQDGVNDLLVGAPGANRRAIDPFTGQPTGPQLSLNGVVYILAASAAGIGAAQIDLFERIEIIGSHDDDQFGLVQANMPDFNGDGISDLAIASPFHDGNGLNAGIVCVIFGNRPITGEQGYAPEQVGTPSLAGIRFVGNGPETQAGADIDSAGDFNGDGRGDLLIASPGEKRVIGGQERQGVVYLIFGGPHLNAESNGNGADNVFELREVGTARLPGIVFVGRLSVPAPGESADIAPLRTVGGVGDVDGDGFDDIMIGAPKVDFVDPSATNQRRVDAGEAYLIYGNNFGPNALP